MNGIVVEAAIDGRATSPASCAGWIGPLGVLMLQNTPMTFLGCLSNPETFAFPILCRTVEGAWVENVVPGDPAVEPAFTAAAKAVAREGAVAVTSNCGFAIRHQRAVADTLAIPVSLSSLLLLPSLLNTVGSGQRVGIATFDSRYFSSDLLPLAGVADPERCVIVGIENTASWQAMSRRNVKIGYDELEADLTGAITQLLSRHRDIAALLFECAGFGPFAPAIRRKTAMPVYDAQTNARLLMLGRGLSP